MIVAPPFAAGVNDTCSDSEPGVTVSRVGADGVVATNPVATADAAPEPSRFTARSST